MKQRLFKKGGNEATLSFMPNQSKPYLACTPVQSKWFKTESGAERFLNRIGYSEKG